MKITTLDQANQALYKFIPNGGKTHKYDLRRMHALMDGLGNPQNKLKVIHVAGTSGKTSTAYFIRGMLQQAGVRTGLTVSPYVTSVTERVQVDGRPLPDADFARYVAEFLPLVKKINVKPTYFEVLMALVYWLFAKLQLDYAVIETGLGGTLDGSNVVHRADKVCVITDIGYDHTEFLGGTLESIAGNKAGIIWEGNYTVVQHQKRLVLDVVKHRAAEQHAKLRVIKNSRAAPTELPLFQKRNWAVAAAAFDYVGKRDGLKPLTANQRAQVVAQQPPGRMEQYKVGDKTVILDGAHNGQKLTSLCDALRERGVTSAAVLAGFKTSRSKLPEMLKALRAITAHLIITEFVVVADVGKVSHTADEVVEMAKAMGYASVEICKDQQQAFKALLARPENKLLITGSLYLVSQLRPTVMATAGFNARRALRAHGYPVALGGRGASLLR
jgi:dihydrofolate synthase / folylpolyglutamate synthase